jgi:hypothetical protein
MESNEYYGKYDAHLDELALKTAISYKLCKNENLASVSPEFHGARLR